MRGLLARLWRRPEPMPDLEPEWLEVSDLRRRLEAALPPLLVDVRGADEFDGPLGHIAGARNVPLGELSARRAELAASGRPVVFVCLSDKRSLRAATECLAAGMQLVAVLRGGMQAWQRAQPGGTIHSGALSLTVCGVSELPDHGAAGITHVLSLLDPDASLPGAYAGFGPHRRLDLRFHDVIEPQPTWIAPAETDVARLLGFARESATEAGRNPHLLIHCHAGVSRSTAAAVLVLAQAAPERPAADLLAEVVRQRPRAWPNLLLLELGDTLLDRRGEIVAAAAAHYRARLDEDPYLAREMEATGRGREIAIARRR